MSSWLSWKFVKAIITIPDWFLTWARWDRDFAPSPGPKLIAMSALAHAAAFVALNNLTHQEPGSNHFRWVMLACLCNRSGRPSIGSLLHKTDICVISPDLTKIPLVVGAGWFPITQSPLKMSFFCNFYPHHFMISLLSAYYHCCWLPKVTKSGALVGTTQ